MEIEIHYALVAHCETVDYKIIACYSPLQDTPSYEDIILAAVKDLLTLEDEKISITRDRYVLKFFKYISI